MRTFSVGHSSKATAEVGPTLSPVPGTSGTVPRGTSVADVARMKA